MRILRNTLLVLLAIVAAIAVWFFGYAWDRGVVRYRLTYEIETPQGLIEATGVIQTARGDTTRLPLPNTGYGYTNKGEAVIGDLGDGRYLFALLREGPDGKGAPENILFQAFRDFALKKRGETPVEFFRRLKDIKPSIEISTELSPLLVTFTDINDPKTVKQVDPDDLAASFCPSASTSADATVHGRKRPATEGGGQPDTASKKEPCVRLKRITLTITDEPVTEGRVEEVLGWFAFPNIDPSLNEGRKSTFRYPNNSPRGYGTITTLDFMSN